MREQMDEDALKKVIKHYPHTRWPTWRPSN